MSVSEQPTKTTVDSKTNIDDTDALRLELNDSFKQKDVKLVPGTKVDLKVFILQQQEPPVETTEKQTTTPVETEPKATDTETDTNESQLKVPQRKISRFLVSPVLSGKLDVPKEKETTPDNTESVEVSETKADVTPDPTKPSIEHEKTPETSESTSTSSTVTSTTSTEAPPVLGPEMINTLEQLKISLDNLKNSSHPTHKKEPSEEIKKSTSAADVTTAVPAAVATVAVPTQTVPATVVPASVPFVTIPPPTTSTIYQNAAITIQPVPVLQPTTTTVPQTVPIVQHTQTYQQPVASVPPLIPQQQPVTAASVIPPPIMIPPPFVAAQQQPPVVVTTSVIAAAVVPTATVPVEDVAKTLEPKKVLENLRHVSERFVID